MTRTIKYPNKPKRGKGYHGGGLTERVYFPIYIFSIPSGWRETTIDYGRGYLDAMRDIKRLNEKI